MENFSHYKEKAEQSVYRSSAEALNEIIETEGLKKAVEKCFELEKIKPVYLEENENPESFAENRKKLNSEAGLIIANHPGYFDSLLVLNALEREDIKIVVSDGNYKTFSTIFGEAHLILANRDPAKALEFLRTIKNYIEEGGLVLLFPTGGNDRVNKEDSSFDIQSGLSVILKKCLKPENMVYSFLINPADIKPLVSESVNRHIGTASAVKIYESMNINNLKDEAEIRVRETYSSASEWQSILDVVPKEGKNEALAKHFMSQFESFDLKTAE